MSLTWEALKTLDGEGPSLCLLSLPTEFLQDAEHPVTFAVPVLKRSSGVMMAIPVGYIAEVKVEAGRISGASGLLGPSKEITVLGVEGEADGSEVNLGVDIRTLLVDFNLDVLGCLKEFEDSTDEMPSLPFFGEAPTIMPSSASLLDQALEWISSGAQGSERVQFYSADEPEQAPRVVVKPKPKAAAPKKLTTAQLSEQMAQMTQIIPVLQAQMQQIQEQQKRAIPSVIKEVPQREALPPYKQSFPVQRSTTYRQDVGGFMTAVGSPPRVRGSAPSTPAKPKAGGMPEDEPQLIPSEEGFLQTASVNPPVHADLPSALLHQGQALSALVSHLIGQDSMVDLSSSASSSGLSMKGSNKRERLRQELASRSGQFLLQVAQNAHRRLKPAELSREIDFLQVPREAGRLPRPSRSGLLCMDPCSDWRSDGCWRQQGCRRTLSAGNGGNRANSSGWRTMGARMDPGTSRGTSCRDFPDKEFCYEPQSTGFCTSMSDTLGDYSSGLCQGIGHHNLKASGDNPCQKGGSVREECGQPGACIQKEAKIPEEAKAEHRSELLAGGSTGRKRDANGAGHSSRDAPDDGLCSGYACQATHTNSTFPSSSSWEGLQDFSFKTWCSKLYSYVLRSRSSFASFLKYSTQVLPSSTMSPASSLFPLPVPRFGIFARRSQGSRERRRKAAHRAFHCVIMALNFWHSDFAFVPSEVLARRPNPAQRAAILRIEGLFKTFGDSVGSFKVPTSGRRSSTLIALLADLSEFMTWNGLAGDAYSGFPGAPGGFAESKIVVPFNDERTEELRPYRSLDPSRLRLHGKANWDPSCHLPPDLWMAFNEPDSLLWTDDFGGVQLPSLEREDPARVFELAKVWDINGLLFLRDRPLRAGFSPGCMRVFNNYKDMSVDRQITDRRGRNHVEGRLLGVSRGLPTGYALCQLEVDPQKQTLKVFCSDRRDFYHQLRVPDRKAEENVMFPPLPVSWFKGTRAYEQLLKRQSLNCKHSRTRHGDLFAAQEGRFEEMPKDKVFVCFRAIGQGDHLGVEHATAAHRNLLRDEGLLQPSTEIRGDRAFRGSALADGLVIDDYYVVSREDILSDSHGLS